MELKDLTGPHVLDYVPRIDLRHPFDADASGCAFGLDGTTYLVFEDPNDGYRSSAADAVLSFTGDLYRPGASVWPEGLKMPVICSMEGRDGSGVLTMREVSSGRVVFEIGTHNADDYYPSYIARWTPPDASEGDA